MVPALLAVCAVPSNNAQPQPVRQAWDVLRPYAGRTQRSDDPEAEGPRDGVVPPAARTTVGEPDAQGPARLRCPASGVPGAPRSRHPAADRPIDFPAART